MKIFYAFVAGAIIASLTVLTLLSDDSSAFVPKDAVERSFCGDYHIEKSYRQKVQGSSETVIVYSCAK